MDEKALKRALDKGFSGLVFDEARQSGVLDKIRGDKVMKKKFSTALALALAALLIFGTAFAVATLRDTGREIAQNEQDSGYFGKWAVEKKVAVVRALAQLGVLENTDEVARLSGDLPDHEASALADAAIEKLTGADAGEVGFMRVMCAVWGDFTGWTHEQKAWYSRVMEEIGIDQSDKTVYQEPTGGIGEARAIDIACAEIASGYGVPKDALDGYKVTVTYEIPEFVDDGQAWWAVQFEAPADMPAEERLFIDLALHVHPATGALYQTVAEYLQILETLPTRPTNALYQKIDAYWAAQSAHFRDWPLDVRARYSDEITPLVRAIVESGDLTALMNCGSPDLAVIAQSSYLYGMPGADDVPQAQAYDAAKAALIKAFGLDARVFDLYGGHSVYFDVTDPEKPLWRFLFNGKSLPADELPGGWDDPLLDTCYRAEIDAKTSAPVSAESFAFRLENRDLDYLKQWY